MSFITGTNVELIYANTAVGIAKNTFTTEIGLNDAATMGAQAKLPPDFWLPTASGAVGRGFHITCRGILSSTVTPSYTWTIRLGGSASITGPIVLGSAAVPTVSGIANAYWEIEGDVILTTLGAIGANSTTRGIGRLISTGLTGTNLTPVFPLYGGAASPGTVATVDTSITNYINVNITCTASSASNTITLQQLLVYGLN
jgi:hypothetical protein